MSQQSRVNPLNSNPVGRGLLGGSAQRWPFAVSAPQAPATAPKTCLGCGAKQQPDGSLPCGH